MRLRKRKSMRVAPYFDPFSIWDWLKARIADLEAENARLQARVEELEGRLEKDRQTAIEHIDEHLKADCVVCGSPHKALAERRKKALKAMLKAAPQMWDHPEEKGHQLFEANKLARAALAATPEEADVRD